MAETGKICVNNLTHQDLQKLQDLSGKESVEIPQNEFFVNNNVCIEVDGSVTVQGKIGADKNYDLRYGEGLEDYYQHATSPKLPPEEGFKVQFGIEWNFDNGTKQGKIISGNEYQNKLQGLSLNSATAGILYFTQRAQHNILEYFDVDTQVAKDNMDEMRAFVKEKAAEKAVDGILAYIGL